MILELQAQVRADVLPLRARKVRKGFVEQTIGIRLNEIPSEEAPVAFRPFDLEGRRIDVRFHDGMLWRPFVVWPPSDDIRVEMAKSTLAWLEEVAIDERSRTGTKEDRLPAGDDAKILSTQRNPVTSATQTWAERNWLVIDGVPHCRALSPAVVHEEIRREFGSAVAVPDAPKYAQTLSAWFGEIDGTPLRNLANGILVDGRRSHLQSKIDIEIVQPDLFELAAEREAGNSSAIDFLRLLAAIASDDQRPHRSLGHTTYAGGRLTLMWRTALAAYVAAAEDGASYLQACETARRSIIQIPAVPRNASQILLPAPEDAVRRDMQIMYQGHKTLPGGPYKGWMDVGNGPKMADVSIAMADPRDFSEIARSEINRYVVDPAGNFLVDYEFTHQGQLNRGRSGILHVEDLAAAASGFARRDGSNQDDKDWLGTAIRHRDGRQPLATNTDREKTIAEFVHHRMVLSDGRMYARCPEPTIAVVPDKGRPKIRPWMSHSISYRTSPAIEGNPPPFMFRLDQLDEALELAACRGAYDAGELAQARITAPLQLSFDSALWNLRAAMKRILDDLDGRILLLEKETAAAVGRLDKHVETWCLDTALVSSEEAVPGFLRDAGMLLAAIEHPLMEDIGEDHVRDIARTSLERAVDDRLVVDIEPAEDFGTFSM